MKQKVTSFCVGGLLACLLVGPRQVSADTAAGIGARQHVDHPYFEVLPYDDGDLSYGLAVEWHDESAYWQLAFNYAPDVTGTNATDYVLTPQINLVFKDNIWRGGLGVLKSYIVDKETGSDWTDVYWQLLLGADLPFYGMQLSLQAFYVFEEWERLEEFDFGDLEYGAWLSYFF